VSQIELNPLLENMKFSQPNSAQTRTEPCWLTSCNLFWHL